MSWTAFRPICSRGYPVLAASSRFGGHGPLLCGLALTRIIGWGSTFYSPSVLVGALDREIGLNAEIVFGGITILLITGALVALPQGQWVPTGERLRVSGEPQQEQAGWLLQVQDVSQVAV